MQMRGFFFDRTGLRTGRLPLETEPACPQAGLRERKTLPSKPLADELPHRLGLPLEIRH